LAVLRVVVVVVVVCVCVCVCVCVLGGDAVDRQCRGSVSRRPPLPDRIAVTHVHLTCIYLSIVLLLCLVRRTAL